MDYRNGKPDATRKTYTGAGQLYLTLVRKQRDEVEVKMTDGQVFTGYIDAFDELGIIIGSSTDPDRSNETCLTRQQIVSISTRQKKCYLLGDPHRE